MVEVEKRAVIEAWDKHIEEAARSQKRLRFSSVADAEFCDTFRKGIQDHKHLSKKEKIEICAYTKLAPEKASAGATRFFCSIAAPPSERGRKLGIVR